MLVLLKPRLVALYYYRRAPLLFIQLTRGGRQCFSKQLASC
nr:MAG TPA: hypothetical protein [Caudoviricetes sp.]